MATTRIIPMHINKGKTIAQCLKARVKYVKNPDKTDGGELISSYEMNRHDQLEPNAPECDRHAGENIR